MQLRRGKKGKQKHFPILKNNMVEKVYAQQTVLQNYYRNFYNTLAFYGVFMQFKLKSC